MKRKPLDRRGWIGITRSRYKQAEIKCDDFHGIVGLLNIDGVSGESLTWDIKAGMKWLHIMPYDGNYVITAMLSTEGVAERWYIDIIAGYGYFPDGVLWFDDLLLDYYIENGVCTQYDMDELDEALETGDITRELYDTAVNAGNRLETYVLNDLGRFDTWCMKLLDEIESINNKGVMNMQKNFTYKSEAREPKMYRYLLSTPENYDPKTESLPLIVFLHGAGERGTDVNLLKLHGIPKLFDKGSDLRVVTVSPQCDAGTTWNAQVKELKIFIDHIADEYNIDKNRISLTGISMGGFGTWSMGIEFPGYFSALAPICGGNGMIWLADLLKDVPIRTFHGTADDVVLYSCSVDMVEAVNKAGGNAALTTYEGVGHDSWVQAYEQTDLIEWLMNQVKA